MPETLTSIGQQTFDGCTSLRTVTLPGSITELGDLLFANCTELEVTLHSEVPPQMRNAGSMENAAFRDVKVIFVPAASVEAYQNTDPWLQWGDKIQPIA